MSDVQKLAYLMHHESAKILVVPRRFFIPTSAITCVNLCGLSGGDLRMLCPSQTVKITEISDYRYYVPVKRPKKGCEYFLRRAWCEVGPQTTQPIKMALGFLGLLRDIHVDSFWTDHLLQRQTLLFQVTIFIQDDLDN